MRESRAHIMDGFVICPACFAKQFPVSEGTKIRNLRYRCRKSTGKAEHFMIIDFGVEEEKKEDE